MSERRLKLLKVQVAPTFVLEDDQGCSPVVGSVVEVNGRDWLAWSATQFNPDRLEELLSQLGEQPTEQPTEQPDAGESPTPE